MRISVPHLATQVRLTRVGGLSARGAALYGLGIPKDSVIKCEAAVKTAAEYLVTAHGGRAAEMERQVKTRDHQCVALLRDVSVPSPRAKIISGFSQEKPGLARLRATADPGLYLESRSVDCRTLF
jgi:hypothetical protein